MKIKCKCGHYYFTIEKTTVGFTDVLLLHCNRCKTITKVAPIDHEYLDVWCPDNIKVIIK